MHFYFPAFAVIIFVAAMPWLPVGVIALTEKFTKEDQMGKAALAYWGLIVPLAAAIAVITPLGRP